MNEPEIKEAVAEILRGGGFEVELLPERNEPTPDLLATKDRRYLIEIKTKEDDPAILADRRSRLATGEVVVAGTPFTPQNTISRVVRKGAEQLAAYPSEERDLCLLWLLAIGSDAEGQCEQFRGTLYGLTNVVAPDNLPPMPCYYMRHSAFFRWRAILDGAVISTLESGQLCLNSYSRRWAQLKDSGLRELFEDGVVDPIDLEERDLAYLADCEIDRNDETALIRYLQEKYRRPALMTMDLGSMTTSVEVPIDQEKVLGPGT